MIDVSELLDDPDLCSNFSIERTTGQYGPGGWKTNGTQTIQAFGATRNAKGSEIQQLPEADRVSEALVFHTTTEIFETNAIKKQTSDILIFRGNRYRILLTKDYSEQGYWYAMAANISGKS